MDLSWHLMYRRETRLREKHRARVVQTDMPRTRALSDLDIQEFLSEVNLDEILNKGDKVLEVGCGSGQVLQGIADQYDVQPYAIDLGDFRSPDTSIDFRLGNAESIPFSYNTFDFAFSYMVFDYIYDKLQAIKEIHRTLKVGGSALVEFGSGFQLQVIVPSIGSVLEQYPNHGQIESKTKIIDRFEDENETQIILYINKTSDEILVFPELKRVHPFLGQRKVETMSVYRS